MKLSLLVVAGLLAPSLEAFTVPSRSATSSIKSFTKLAFVPKNDVSTTEPTSTFADGKLNTASLSPLDLAKKDQTVWDKFANWITSTENRLYIGWFGALMFPLSLPPRPASLLPLLQPLLVSDLNLPCHQNLCQFFSRMIVFSQSTLTASGSPSLVLCCRETTLFPVPLCLLPTPLECSFSPIWEAISVDEWLYSGKR